MQFLSDENVKRLQRAAGEHFPHAPTESMVRQAQSEAIWKYGTAFHQGSTGLLPGGQHQTFTQDCAELNQHTLDILIKEMEMARHHENWYDYMLSTPVGDFPGIPLHQ